MQASNENEQNTTSTSSETIWRGFTYDVASASYFRHIIQTYHEDDTHYNILVEMHLCVYMQILTSNILLMCCRCSGFNSLSKSEMKQHCQTKQLSYRANIFVFASFTNCNFIREDKINGLIHLCIVISKFHQIRYISIIIL